jgi:hypothetical protein
LAAQRQLAVTALNADYRHRYFEVIRVSAERLHGLKGAISRVAAQAALR